MSDISRQIADLPPDKLEQLLKRLAQKRQAAPRPQIPPRPADTTHLPLSSAQQRLWLLDQLEPGNPLYNLAGVVRLRGPLDVPALEVSLNAIVQRHESLRTTFAVADGQPTQRVAASLALPLHRYDLSDLADEPRQQALDAAMLSEANHTFDLAHGPLMRAALVRLAPEEHVLLLTMHHIISDGWSLSILSRELGAFYAARTQPGHAPLPPLAIQYPDYALWQREQLAGEGMQAHLDYWRERLAGAPPLLELPTDLPRPPVQTYRGERLVARLPAAIVAPLRVVSQQAEATLFMALLAAFKLLLYRLTSQEDIVVGTPIAGRSRREVEGLIGFFLNTLVLRSDLSGTPTFREVVARVRETALGAYAHQDLPFERLLEALQPDRDLSHTPFFQVFFNMLNLPETQMALAGLSVELLTSPDLGAKFDLTLYAEEQGDEVQLELVYNADLFHAERMNEFLQQFHDLLAQATARPDEPITQHSLVTRHARTLLPNPTEAQDATWHGAISEALTRQAALAPAAIAVQDPSEAWSYAELEARSNQLAHALRAHGVQPEEVVALYAHRNASLVWALMGILKAGAAFTMLDPTYPAARLVDYLDVAQPRGFLHLEAAGVLPAEVEAWLARSDCRCRLVLPARSVAAATGLLAEFPAEPPAVALGPESLACVTFTSGSTGKPKGVLGRHGPLTHFYPWLSRTFGLGASDRVSMVSGLAHDPLQRDIFTPLWLGATICVPDPDEIRIPGRLAEWMAQAGVTVTHLTPALGQILTETAPGSTVQIPSLRYAFIVGDILTRRDVARIRTLAPAITCVNFYGSTETQRAVGYYPVPDALTVGYDEAAQGRVKEVLALGKGMPDVQVLVMNAHQHLSGIGEVGEIYLRSPHLARGYLADPTLTAHRFLVNPFTHAPGDRLYRTGDLGRYRPDGNVEFVGRADLQVKIRGFRIELGEIEGVLTQHPAVREAVVIARDDLPGQGRRLVGYLVPALPEQPPSHRELYHYVKAKLPDYMVPAAFVTLEQLPLTPNRKIDRRALPRPDLTGDEAAARVAPRTPIEEVVAAIWADVLGSDWLDVHANFFELGGHSLLATQVIARVRDAFRVALPLRRLFEVPTVAGLAESIEAAYREQAQSERPPLVPTAHDSPAPLSFPQERLWLLEQLTPGTAAYHIPLVVRIGGPLDTQALERSLNALIARHDSLRTTLVAGEGDPVQLVAPSLTIPLPVERLAEGNGAHSVEDHIRAEVQRPFTLEAGPLLRARLFHLAPEEHLLVLVLHHFIADGWSLGVLIRDLAALYPAARAGRATPVLEPLPLQYADFARWQRQWLQGDTLAREVAYWRGQLAGAPPLLELPTDFPRPAVQSYRGAQVPLRLPAPLTEALKRLSQREKATLFMVLLAAFQALLARYSRQSDILVGSPVANRTHPDLEGLIGVFINTLLFRADLSDNPTFRDLVGRVREAALAAYAHQDLPFEKLVEALAPQRSLSYSPLFQALFILHNLPMPSVEIEALTLTPLEPDRGSTQFDLSLELVERGDSLEGVLVYNPDLFEAATIARLGAHFVTLLEAIAHDPTQRVATLPLLPPDERAQLLVAWNETAAPYPRALSLHALVEAQAARTPDAVALRFGDEALTYRELDARANQLAHALRQRGVGPETLVGLLMERSAAMVVGLLGILKAGGTYVPLDPAYPSERVAYVLEDSRAALLVTEARLRDAAPPGLARLELDSAQGMLAAQATTPPVVPLSPDHAAYVIYTSGSTGRPKGVVIPHYAVVNFLHAMAREPGLSAEDTLLAVTTLSFDIAGLELFLPLMVGAQVVVAPREVAADGQALAALLAASGATVMQATPTTWRLLLEAGWTGQPPLRALCGGEALPRRLANQLLALGVELWNLYGPTETTIWSSALRVAAGEGAVVIGPPIANTQFYILDGAGQPVPVGVAGELFIGGDGLARGYLRRPALTAERFTPDPFGSTPGARLYTTGDVARYRPDGTIEILGRADFQVKLRGYRIELGEIESVLEQHPAVQQSVVMVHGADSPAPRLVGYMVPRDGAALPALDDLRAFLRERLPDYMVPPFLLTLDALPLTPNGKVDRRALPAPTAADRPPAADAVAPRTPTEAALQAIWADVLEQPGVGITENFFEVGGHSLTATQVIGRIQRELGVTLPLRLLFSHPTIEALAQAVESQERGPTQDIPRLPDAPDYALSHAQHRLWILAQLEGSADAYHMPGALLLDGEIAPDRFQQALDALVQRHESLRTTFREINGEPRQIIHPWTSLPLRLRDLTGESDPEGRAQALADEDARQPFDLERGPLLRVTLVRLAPARHVLLVNSHHLISDAWSVARLVREFMALYEALGTGQAAPLPPLRLHYRDYAAWQNALLASEAVAPHRDYWHHKLGGVLPLLDLPSDFPRPPVKRYTGQRHTLYLDAGQTAALQALGQREQASLFMVLVAAVKTLLYRYTGQTDILVGSPIAGRTHADLEAQLGLYINMLVLRDEVAGELPFRDLLERVKESATEAYEHQVYPFDRLVNELNVSRDPSRHPIFDVAVVLQNVAPATLALPGVTIQPFAQEYEASKFDLTFTFEPEGERLRLDLTYTPELYLPERVARLGEHFRELIGGILDAPGTRLDDLPLLSAAERARLLNFNRATPSTAPTATLIERFERQVARAPQAVALRFEEETISYAALNERANQLAHHLRTLGVGAETLVGLCLERSVDLVVGLLGILKAGGAYLPLDPTYPSDRLAFMVEDAEVPVVVTQARLWEPLGIAGAGAPQVVCPDQDSATLAAQPTHDPEPGAMPEHLAYVIYTSGSTGLPKGVLVSHANVVRLFDSTEAWFGFNERDVWTLFHSYAFDFSVWELWGALLYGGTLVIVPYLVSRAPDQFLALLEREGVTVLNQTPSAFRQLVQAEGQLAAPAALRLRTVIFGGEALEMQSLRPWFERHGDAQPHLVNMYGITETTVHVTYRPIGWADLAGNASVIGRAIPDLSLYILDGQRRPVPLGITGEIYVGGAGVARGYLKRPDLTRERFIPDPFSDEPGARLYKTGDLARYLPNGDMEYLGRSDQQVKIRGFRIELGEIEASLSQHPAVAEALVMARDLVPGSQALVAYLVLHAGQTAEPSDLRAFLSQSLPDYMLPAAFVFLPAFPLTSNGKVDRRALPAPERTGDEATFVAPRTPTEAQMAAIWAELLGVERVGVHDNFFELGGHSLLATQVVARLRSAFRVELPLRRLFETPTIAGLAQAVAGADAERQRPQAPPLLPVARETPYQPLSFAQQRLWFLYQLEPESPFYNIPAAVRIEGRLDVALLERSLADLTERHEILRTTFATRGEQPVQVIHPTQPVALTQVDLRALPDAERAAEARRLALEAIQRPFDLIAGPLWRVTVLQTEEARYTLLLILHHIIADGWTMGLLIGEVLTLYQAHSSGQPAALPAATLQYADFAHWQRAWLQGEVLDAQMDYWQQRLAGAPPLLALPTDRPRPPTQTFRGAAQPVTLAAPLPEALHALSRAEGSTLFMTLLAAFQLLMRWQAKQDDFVLGTDVAGRDREETETLLGCFVNQLPLRATFTGDPTFREHLAQVRQQTLDAYDHQDVPFEKLVEVLNPKRQNYAPIFQVKIVLHNIPRPTLALPDLSFEGVELERDVAQLDLQLNLAELPGELVGVLEYNTDLFEGRTAAQLVALFEALLHTLTRSPDLRLSEAMQALDQAVRERERAEQERFREARRARFQAPRRPVGSGGSTPEG